MNAVELQEVVVGLKDSTSRSRFTLCVEAGTSLALVGPNRAGKSLLVSLCAGLVEPDEGRVAILGQDLATLDEEQWVELRQRVGVVLEQPGLLSNQTVFNNVALPLRYHRGLTDAEIEPLVMERLEELGVAQYRHFFPAQLNQGEARCVAMARALIMGQQVLLLDDPLEGMDSVMIAHLRHLLDAHRARRALTIVASMRRPSSMLPGFDRLAYVQDGRVAQVGSYDELLAQGDPALTTYLQ